MRCFQKSMLGIKNQTVVQKYDTFEIADRLGKSGAFPIELVHNCDLSDGNARVGVGASIYTLESGEVVYYDWDLSAPKAFFYYGEKLWLLTEENRLYFYDEDLRTYERKHTFNGAMKVVEAQDESGTYQVYFCGEAGIFHYDNNWEITQIFDQSCLPIGCAFQGRIFTASADLLLYSAPFSMGDFSESIDGGGAVVLPSDTGEIVDIAATSNALFVFCQYGIWKLTAAGSARDFRLERVGFTGNGILKGSACSVAFSGGEKLFFFDEYGPWKLDRSGVKQICRDLSFSIRKTEQVCEHAYLNGQVVYNYCAVDGSVKNLVIDAETDRAYHSFTAQGLSDLKGQAVGVVDGLVCALKEGLDLPTYALSELVAKKCDFNLSGVKTLRQLRIFGEGKITLSVFDGRKTKTFALQMENGMASVDVRLKGEFFRLRFVLGNHAILRGLDVELSKLKATR